MAVKRRIEKPGKNRIDEAARGALADRSLMVACFAGSAALDLHLTPGNRASTRLQSRPWQKERSGKISWSGC